MATFYLYFAQTSNGAFSLNHRFYSWIMRIVQKEIHDFMKKIQRNGGSIYEVHESIRIIYEFCADPHKKATVSTAVSPLSQ